MNLILYLVQVTFCLAFFYAFYHLILRKETLFETNRFYLVITLASSIVLPLIKIYIDSQSSDTTTGIAPYVYVGTYVDAISTDFAIAKTKPFPWDRLIVGIYALGIAVMAIRLLNAVKEIQLIRQHGMKRMVNGQWCILSDQVKSPFSFFDTIYFPKQHQFGETELKEIVAHELAHVKGRHTLDVLFMETACILLWPSPMIYFYRKALKDVHEYVADAAVIRNTPWENYAQLLIGQQQGQLQNILSNQLIYSQLKKRLLMMNKERSGSMAGLKYLGFIPVLLIALVLFSFREKNASVKEANLFNNEVQSERIIHLSLTADQKIYYKWTEIPKDELESFLRKQISLTNDTLLYVRIDKTLTVADLSAIDEIGQKLKIWTVFEPDNVFNLYRDGLPIKTGLGHTFGIEASDREHPIFPGCTNVPLAEQEDCSMAKMAQYVQDNMFYPESVKEAGIEGMVVVKFTVGVDGLVKDIQVVKSIHPYADQVVVNLISNMNAKVGKWIPATKEGKPHDAEMHLPVKFALDKTAAKEEPLLYAEELPRFPGCEDIENTEERSACANQKMYGFICSNIIYPKEDRDNNIQGQVIVQFVIGADGSISAINVVRTPSESMRLEVIRLMNLMAAMPDKWIPARQDGKAVAMRFTIPVKFILQDDKVKGEPSVSDSNDANTTVTVIALSTQAKSKDSEVVSTNTTPKTISIVPNPATESIAVELIEGTHTVNILSLSGNLVLTQKINSKSGTDKVSINVSSLPSGQYAVQVLSSAGSATGSFTIVK